MRKMFVFTLIALVALLAVPLAQADGPVEGRAGRAEVRFLEGMIDHHQMAVDMANHCLGKVTNEQVRAICENVITAQTAEIDLMRGWLVAWYNIDYTPMAMDSMMMMTDMVAMMDSMTVSDMMAMMEGMEDVTMHEMMMSMMGEDHQHGMMGEAQATPEAAATEDHSAHHPEATPEATPEAAATEDHSAHHPEATAEAATGTDHSQHSGMNESGMYTDMPMMMGMMAGLDRLEGNDYDLAWLEAMIDHHDDALHMAERILGQAEHEPLRTLAEKIIADQTAEIESMEALITELSAS